METVDVIASGYEWICPKCNEMNTEIEYEEFYQCEFCGEKVETDNPRHAY